MKKFTLSVLLVLSAIVANAQTCFNYYRQPGTSVVQFMPDSMYSNNYYHCHWDFKDGSPIDTVSYAPTHTFNSTVGAEVCCEIRDNITDSLVCYSCDSIFFIPIPNCNFSLIQQSGSVVLATAQPAAGTYVEWVWGDGSFDLGNTAIHTYPVSGPYNVCMTVRDSMFHNILCNPCSLVIIQSSLLCNYTVSQTSPLSFDFTGNVAPSANLWWDFGDGNTDSTGSNQVSHIYSSPGTYYVCINSLDTTGQPCQYCDYITAGSVLQSCIFSSAPSQFIPNAFTFYPQISGTFANISWDFGDGSTHVDSISSPVTHTYSTTGVYTVCMKLSDALGNITCTSCNIVLVNSTTNCNFFYTVNSTNNLQIGFAVNVSAPVHTVSWTFGDNTSDVGDSVVHNFNFPGTYQVCVTIVENGSVTCSSCQWVTVGSNSGNCSILYWDTIPTNTERFYLQTVWSPLFPINWDFGDGSNGSGQLIDHTYANPGTYTVCAVQLDTAGAQVCSTCVNVIIGSGPVSCQASFLSTSLGLTGYFIDLSVTPLNNTSYSWDFGDGGTSNIRFPQHSYALPGTYTVCQTITSGNCVDQFCSPILIDSTINPALGCQAFFAIVQLATFQVSVVNLSSGVNLSFSWDFGDGTTDTLPYPSHLYNSTGVYNLCLTVTDGNGCSSTYCDTIQVDSLGFIYRSMTGFALNVYAPMQITTGVSELNPTKSFKAFPNPVSNDLFVTSSVEKIEAYRILSIQGAEINSGKLSGTENIINMQKFSLGSYLLEVRFSDGSRNYQAIIKN